MHKRILRTPQMLEGIQAPSFHPGVGLLFLIAYSIYALYTKVTVVGLLAYLLPLIFGNGFFSLDVLLAELNASQSIMLISLFVTAVLTAMTIIYLIKIEKRPLRTAGFERRSLLPKYLVGFVLGAVALLLCFALVIVSDDITYLGFTVFVPLYLVAFIIQSSSEEIFFRGFFMTSLSKRIGIVFGVLISSAVFSIMHAFGGGYSLLGGIYYMSIGAFLALLMLRTNSIWASCGFHAAWNFTIGLLASPMNVGGFEVDYAVFRTAMSDGDALPGLNLLGDPYYLILIGVFVAACAILLFVGKNKLVVRAPQPTALPEPEIYLQEP